MNAISIDIETLGTNVDSQILSVGACMFDLRGTTIGHTFYYAINIDQGANVNATVGAIKFWLEQAKNNPEALKGLMNFKTPFIDLQKVLIDLSMFIGKHRPETVWANGTKFDLGLLEYNYKKLKLDVPWEHNQDRCLRTLKQFAGNLEIESEGTSHNALSDARWQAKYIQQAIFRLGI